MNRSKNTVKQAANKDTGPRRSAGPATVGPGDRTLGAVTPERVRLRAYEIYQVRNGAPGDEVSDWCAAEAELNGAVTSRPARPGRDAAPTPPEFTVRTGAARRGATPVPGGL